ncbi:MAG: hypothetical protein KAJ01_02280 [Candidatus Hydrogenedentes bacterium]|nr:hypothetical protein [Candidatus Hydrogenedentota bacterium]
MNGMEYTKDDALEYLASAATALEDTIEKFEGLADLLEHGCDFQEPGTAARIRAYTIATLQSFLSCKIQSGSVANIRQEINYKPDEEQLP